MKVKQTYTISQEFIVGDNDLSREMLAATEENLIAKGWDIVRKEQHTVSEDMRETEPMLVALSMYRRGLYFDNEGKCLGSFPSFQFASGNNLRAIDLPSDHYDFRGPINVLGKTYEEIEKDVETFKQENNIL